LVTVQIDKVKNIHCQYNTLPSAGPYYKVWPSEMLGALSFNFVSSSEC